MGSTHHFLYIMQGQAPGCSGVSVGFFPHSTQPPFALAVQERGGVLCASLRSVLWPHTCCLFCLEEARGWPLLNRPVLSSGLTLPGQGRIEGLLRKWSRPLVQEDWIPKAVPPPAPTPGESGT